MKYLYYSYTNIFEILEHISFVDLSIQNYILDQIIRPNSLNGAFKK